MRAPVGFCGPQVEGPGLARRKGPRQTQAKGQGVSQTRLACVLALGLFALALAWERGHGYWEPQQPPVAAAALLGHGLVQGHALYSELWDSHPPALGISFALAEALGGY